MTAPRLSLHALRALAAVCLVAALPGAALRAQQRADSTSASAADSARSVDPNVKHFEPVPDRWRSIVPPPYELNVEGRWYDPYNQNILKGDYPIAGQNTFFVLAATLDNAGQFADLPTPSGTSTREALSDPFFGEGRRFGMNNTLKLTLELYHGDVAYRPRDWEVKVTGVMNFNYVALNEFNNVHINVRKGDTRADRHFAFEELSFEKHLADLSDRYDFISLRAGIQRFSSDFRGFIFSDYNLGARLFGNADDNKYQYNVIVLPMLEKETNSELNTVFDDRQQTVGIANLYLHDLLALGHTTQFSVHYSNDRASEHFDENGVPVRPALLGNSRPHEIAVWYAGWAGDGHFGALNITHAVYYAFGSDDFNSLAGRAVDIGAQMAALELSVDEDWMRFRVSAFYASGDGAPDDGTGAGFDAIIDAPFFAGGAFSFWNSQGIGLQGVGLVHRASLLPSLRSNKFEGQANFVNPGILILNAGYDAEIAPTLKGVLNANFLRFAEVAPLETFLHQNSLHRNIGIDCGLGFVYRPFLNNNAIVTAGASALLPLDGWTDIYESSSPRFAMFASLILTY
ncbi:MAG: hypothetical protein IPP94_16745 [Ignavibacteria bacterium]|nr:hypothetical protein [Ignavibacteria bacterium]